MATMGISTGQGVGFDMDAPDPASVAAQAKAREEADVARWAERIKRARKYDEPAREQYAKDRRYARGDSGFEVDANLVGTYIDVMGSFLYARNPDVDVRPAETASVPSHDALQDAAEASAQIPPEAIQAINDQAMAAIKAGTPVEQAVGSARAAQQFAQHMAVSKQAQALRDAYAKKRADNKAFAETLEIVVSRLWQDAGLKRRGVRWVRSAMTTGLGIIKASWQERTAPSPETARAINDLKTVIGRVQAARQEMADNAGDQDAELAEYRRQLADLQAKAQEVVARGFVVDVVQPEDFQVAPGFALADHTEAPWNAQRRPMPLADARAEFQLTQEQARAAKKYTARTPVMVERESPLLVDGLDAKDADAFVAGENAEAGGGQWVMVWEIWDQQSGSVLTSIEGVKQWVKPAWQPPQTQHWYPFFLLAVSEVDGQRHPQSLVSRSAKLVDEYNRIGSAEAEHRRRCLPALLFHKGQIGAEAMVKINGSTVGEYIGVDTTQPNTPLSQLFFPKPYPTIDPGLYDRQRIMQELERIWGIQEALSGAVNVAKTATEAQIQQTGFQSRTTSRRDEMEAVLTELAIYTAEVAREYMSDEDAREIAGPNAMWPPVAGHNDLASMVHVDIRAGSSGKPDTAIERQAWATQLPLLQQAVVQIGQLRQSDPLDIADSLEMLLQITAERSGDRVDIDQLVPKAGQPAASGPAPGPDQGAQPPGAPPPAQGMPPTPPHPDQTSQLPQPPIRAAA